MEMTANLDGPVSGVSNNDAAFFEANIELDFSDWSDDFSRDHRMGL
jgi:hypothetical protein